MPVSIWGMRNTVKTIMKRQPLHTTMYCNPKRMRIPGKALITIKGLPWSARKNWKKALRLKYGDRDARDNLVKALMEKKKQDQQQQQNKKDPSDKKKEDKKQ